MGVVGVTDGEGAEVFLDKPVEGIVMALYLFLCDGVLVSNEVIVEVILVGVGNAVV